METLQKDAKTGILYQQWKAASPKACLLLVHGLGAHSGRWKVLAEYFLAQDISSYALELQGFGQTQGTKGHIDSFDTYYDNIRALAVLIRSENPGSKIFLVGESFGGLLSYIMVQIEPSLFSGLILLSPAFSIRLQVSMWDYMRVFLHLFVNPQKQFKVRFVGDMCTRDPRFQEQIDTDFLEHRLVSAKFVLNYFYAERAAFHRIAVIEMPVLFLVPSEDKLVSPQASKVIFYRLLTRDKELIKYPEMYHALSVELGKEQVFADIRRWLAKRI
ncbi:MAG: alpha/beta fold hydrolase [Candidatus Omnitrophica bacterium]|nr:alpha/beta fold hydrolase [Candidatus Omnitrophota bacterium]